MKSEEDDFLYLLLWGAETLARPTFRNLTEGYMPWAYRRGLYRPLRRLEKRQLIETRAGGVVERICRLTERGRIAALGGTDPEARWDRPWDGKWRVVVFDLPEKQNASRVRLRRYLKAEGFGYLQRSVWISPDPFAADLKRLSAKGEEAEALLTVEAHPCSDETNASIVTGSWDFEEINGRYEACLGLLENPPAPEGDGASHHQAKLHEWARQERLAWKVALDADPLLPSELLPAGYLGREAWRRRTKVLREAGAWLV